MSPSEFFKYDAGIDALPKARKYDKEAIADKLVKEEEIRKNTDYQQTMYWILKTATKFDQDEAIDWMNYYMEVAIAYGIETKNLDWKTKFMACWDAYDNFIRVKRWV